MWLIFAFVTIFRNATDNMLLIGELATAVNPVLNQVC